MIKNRKLPNFKESTFAKYGKSAKNDGVEEHKTLQLEIRMKEGDFLKTQ